MTGHESLLTVRRRRYRLSFREITVSRDLVGMSAFSQLDAFCQTIRPRVTIPVLLGRPDAAVPGLYVWPWRMEPEAELSNRPGTPSGGRPEASLNQPILSIRILIIPVPALSAESVASLENAQLALHDHPLFTAGETVSRVVADRALSVGDLSALFAAAQLPFSLCAAFVLSGQARRLVNP